MSTWAELLADLRTDLKDTGSTERYSDEALYLWVKDAIRDYSQFYPLYNYREELTETNDVYPLPSDFVKDITVESPANTYLETRGNRPGIRYSEPGLPSRYWLDGGNLHLDVLPPTDQVVLLTYTSRHGIPSAYDDTTFVMTIPEEDEELIRLYVKAKAVEQVRTLQSNLDRFKLGSGSRDDNPLQPEVLDLMTEYRRKLAERDTGGVVLLYRPGRRR